MKILGNMNNVDHRPVHGGQYMFRFKTGDQMTTHFGAFLIDNPNSTWDSEIKYFKILLLKVRKIPRVPAAAPVFLDLKEVVLSTSRETNHKRGNRSRHVVVRVDQAAIVLVKKIYVCFDHLFGSNTIQFRTGMSGVYFISSDLIFQEKLKTLATSSLHVGRNRLDNQEWIRTFEGFVYSFEHNNDCFNNLAASWSSRLAAERVAAINHEHEYHVLKIRLHTVCKLLCFVDFYK